jgi:hypothetical protein
LAQVEVHRLFKARSLLKTKGVITFVPRNPRREGRAAVVIPRNPAAKADLRREQGVPVPWPADHGAQAFSNSPCSAEIGTHLPPSQRLAGSGQTLWLAASQLSPGSRSRTQRRALHALSLQMHLASSAQMPVQFSPRCGCDTQRGTARVMSQKDEWSHANAVLPVCTPQGALTLGAFVQTRDVASQ